MKNLQNQLKVASEGKAKAEAGTGAMKLGKWGE